MGNKSGKKAVPPCVGEGMVTRKVILRASDVVLLKAIVEAHDGVAQVFGERGGGARVGGAVEP